MRSSTEHYTHGTATEKMFRTYSWLWIELKIGWSPQIFHDGVCSGLFSLAAISKADFFFFYCWKLTKLYLLDKGQMTLALRVNVRAVISHILKLTYFIPTHSKTTLNCLRKLFFLIFSELAVTGCIQTWGKWILSLAIVPAPPPPPDSNSHLWEYPPSLSSPAT